MSMCVCVHAHTCACVAGLGGLRKGTPERVSHDLQLAQPPRGKDVCQRCRHKLHVLSLINYETDHHVFVPDSESQLKKERLSGIPLAGPVVRSLWSHCQGHRFNPKSGN